MGAFDHTTWIDRQREAGDKRSNVFADILRACEAYRDGGGRVSQALADRRVARVESMRSASAEHDAQSEQRHGRPSRAAPTFDELVEKWKGQP
ncbi:MAG: hypothetical protein LCH79_15980 [Proteobacteria bacterium]|nr:hypothetical protein [Pseudomonadota bacterium]